MDERSDDPLGTSSTTSASGLTPGTSPNLQIDPKLLEKALKKMKGLINGNGLSINKVALLDTPDNHQIKIFRFKARTTLKLIPQYGIKTEPGRNMNAKLMPSDAEFKRAIAQIAIDARTNPIKRKQIVDFVFSRSDKGFGIKEQRTKFHALSRDFVQHERCPACGTNGRTTCARCHGKGQIPCTQCHGRRHVNCPRCRGSARIETPKGTMPCQFCRGDGRVNCNLCGARGTIKCQPCAATGSIACRTCAASGWMSHLAHVEIFAQIRFNFDRAGLPSSLIEAIEKKCSALCREK